MPRAERAKQFSPFSPLKGLEEALAQKERLRVPRRELCEDCAAELNASLTALEIGQLVTVYYYDSTEQTYLQLTGPVSAVDAVGRSLGIGKERIPFDDLYEIVAEEGT